MNALELTLTAALLMGSAVVLMPVLGFMRLRMLERRLERLQELTYTFTDASARLSQALERGAIEPQIMPVRSEASRRSLIHSARNQLDAGAPMDRLTVELGLRRDELCLMDIGRRAGTAQAVLPTSVDTNRGEDAPPTGVLGGRAPAPDRSVVRSAASGGRG